MIERSTIPADLNAVNTNSSSLRFVAIVLLVLVTFAPKTLSAQRLSDVNSWAYQLQDIDLEELASSPYQLIVLDYSEDGSADTEFSFEEIEQLKNSGKKAIAYLSIGEAEDYRFYFKSFWTTEANKSCGVKLTNQAPAWLENPNKNFCGNYKTRFWKTKWQRIIYGNATGSSKSYLDRIIDAGFDGVYLDIIDGYEYWLHKPLKKRRKTAAADMAKFVERIATYARVTRGNSDFIIIPQNGSLIIDDLSTTDKNLYLETIDGIGAEDTYYYGDNNEDNNLDIQEETRAALLQYVAAGKKVFSVDYLTDQSKIDDFRSRACADSFIPQVARRDLSSLEDHQQLECD